ncbi:MAG TPA: tetratricopeptide repeat protein [Planctomycetaceae bacterium]|nr:tetratricopeptide repeat protein [Planctomycetaceae bacterium]
MRHLSKSLLFAAIAFGCAAMMLPSTAEARGGGGGGGRGGGGGGGGRGMGGGGMSRGVQGGGAFRGVPGGGNGNFSRGTNFNRGSVNNWNRNGNWNWNRGGNWNRWNGGWGWGWAIGPAYWGFGSPYWYGGYPFWYDTLAAGAYVNPYYTNAYDYGGYDYGVPIQQNQPSQNDPGSDDDPHFAAARAAFYAGNYQEALREATLAVADMPTSDAIHEFHGLVLFALGDYQKAAAVAHTTLDAGPGWNWSIVQSLYPSADVYTQQLRNLEHSISERPDQAATRFLLGYEYLMLGHLKAARRQFDRVVALEPRDTLAKNIVAGLARAPGVTGQDQPQGPTNNSGGPVGPLKGGAFMPTGPANGPQGPGNQGPVNQGLGNQGPAGPDNANSGPATPPGPPQPADPGTAGPAAASLAGTWKSSPAPGVTIEATLKPDKHFTWKFSEGGQAKSFTGTYTQQGDNLVLTRDEDGQKMDGTITMNGDKGFRFRLRNTDPADPGLDFAK